ncbi:MAG: hypothetical protein Q9209_000295 [Squamulea sp. 1 TL-2023]
MSASPTASTSDGQASGQPAKPGNEQVKFRFCGDCSNMLAPKEDRINNKLMYCCRMCQYSEEADSACIFRNNIYNVIGETAGVTQDVGSDPTVGLPDLWCTLCGQAITCGFYDGVDDGELEDDDLSSEGGKEEDDDYDDDEHDGNDVGGLKNIVKTLAANQNSHDTEPGGNGKNTLLT